MWDSIKSVAMLFVTKFMKSEWWGFMLAQLITYLALKSDMPTEIISNLIYAVNGAAIGYAGVRGWAKPKEIKAAGEAINPT